MNCIHFCWFSSERPTFPYFTALPSVDCLNNLANWSRHLATNTKFIPILWVNAAVFKEINSSTPGNTSTKTVFLKKSKETYFNETKSPGHIVVSGNANIKALLPQIWQESYEHLVKKINAESIVFWQARSKNVLYDNSRADMRILVVNIENFFEFHAKSLPVFSATLKVFQELLAEKFFVHIKDFTVNFLITLLGGFYFDLDLKSKLNVPFFQGMNCVKNAVRFYYNRTELMKHGEILTLLKHNKYNLKDQLDVGMKVNVGDVVDFVTIDQLQRQYIVSENEKKVFRKNSEACRKAIANSPHQMIANLLIEEKQMWFDLYEKDPYEVIKKLNEYEKESMMYRIQSIKFFNQYYSLLFEALDERNDCIYNYQFKEGFQDWLRQIYTPFYDFHFGNKFSQVDANQPSHCFYLGYHLIEEQVQAGRILTHYARCYLNHNKLEKINKCDFHKVKISLL